MNMKDANMEGSPAPDEALRARAHRLIPGGAHTYAKGDDQYPANAPPFIVRGRGCRVEDMQGRTYIEYGMGLRAVTLGHAFPAVVEAAANVLQDGCNFTRPNPREVFCAEELVSLWDEPLMVKFGKNGSDATSGALRLARAYTGRDLVACCADHPFFSVDDWFIGTTPMNAGIPQSIRDLTKAFRYNDFESVQTLFQRYPGQIAAVMLEGSTYVEPADDFLPRVQAICQREGALFILDEMITGFRWALGGARQVYQLQPDLATYGKAIGNGFSVSALIGKPEIMRLGGLLHDDPRVFLMSYTHGAELVGLAAAQATIQTYRTQPVVETLYRQGERLRGGLERRIRDRGLHNHVQIIGRPCNLIFTTLDATGRRSQAFRTLFLQEMIKRGVLGPSFVVSYSHDDQAIDATIDAADGALAIYAAALQDGVDRYLQGPVTKPVFRRFNQETFS